MKPLLKSIIYNLFTSKVIHIYDEKDHSLKVKYVVSDETREAVLVIANVPSIDGHVYEENTLKLLSGKLHF